MSVKKSVKIRLVLVKLLAFEVNPQTHERPFGLLYAVIMQKIFGI